MVGGGGGGGGGERLGILLRLLKPAEQALFFLIFQASEG